MSASNPLHSDPNNLLPASDEQVDTTSQLTDLRRNLEHINAFLQAIGTNHSRISELLSQTGLDNDAINELRHNHLARFLSCLQHRWQEQIIGWLPERHANIVIRRFGLDEHPSSRLIDLGDTWGVSRERIRQLEVAGLRRLRTSKRQKQLLQTIPEIARSILSPSNTQEISSDNDTRPTITVNSQSEDWLQSAGKELISNPDLLAKMHDVIIACVYDLSDQLSRSGIAKLLVGSLSIRVEQYREYPLYGVFQAYYRYIIMQLIDQLIDNGRLVINDHNRLTIPTKLISNKPIIEIQIPTEEKVEVQASSETKLIPDYIVKARLQYPRAYERWSADEDEALRAKFHAGTLVKDLAVEFQRQPNAITARLTKLGLLIPKH